MKFSFASAFAAVTAALALSGGALHAQTPFYSAATTTAAPQTGAEHFLELISFANSPATYTLSTFNLGVNYADATQNAGVIVEFYTGLDTSNTSTDVLANATYLTGVSGTLAAPGTNGNYTYTFTLNTPYTFPAGTSTVGVNIYLTTSDGASYASGILNGRFTASAPTVGTSAGYVWNDANLDSTFTGAEKTNFGLAQANIRFALNGTTTAVPEPSTYALLGAAGLVFGGLSLRRRSVRA